MFHGVIHKITLAQFFETWCIPRSLSFSRLRSPAVRHCLTLPWMWTSGEVFASDLLTTWHSINMFWLITLHFLTLSLDKETGAKAMVRHCIGWHSLEHTHEDSYTPSWGRLLMMMMTMMIRHRFSSVHSSQVVTVQLEIGDLCLVSTIPLRFCRSFLPFRCAVVTFHCTVAVLPFRSYCCHCGWEWKCWKRLSVYIHRDEETRTLIGCPPTAEWQK